MSLENKIDNLIQSINILTASINKLTTNNIQDKPSIENKLIPVTLWNKYHSWPPTAGLRHIIFNEKTNGASVFIRRVGKRVLIDEAEFFNWAKSNNFK